MIVKMMLYRKGRDGKKEQRYLYTPYGGAEGVAEQDPVLVTCGVLVEDRKGKKRNEKEKDIKHFFRSPLERFL